MADVKWIKITTNIFDDEKMKLIDVLPERDALIVIWFKLLAMAGKTNDNGLVYVMKEMATTDHVLSTVFNRPLTTVQLALNTFQRFNMIEINEHINIVNWEKHQNIEGLDKIREQTRKRVENYRKKQKKIECNVTVTDSNGTDKIRIDKNRIDKIRIEEEKYNTYIDQNSEFFSVINNQKLFLSISDKEKLENRYPKIDIDIYCTKLTDYCRNKKTNYKSVYLTINTWIKRDIEKNGTYDKILKEGDKKEWSMLD